jgi:NADH dehydrogenase [ubiquinone] 1 alpha subcomplex assembly factor 1
MISIMLYDFSQNSLKSDWQIVDDVVMGGRSEGEFSINEEGNGIFQGKVSLENNGGFSSLRHSLNAKVGNNTKVRITLKGDGKAYQFRIKSSPYDRHSYISEFQTTGVWQEVVIPLSAMYPAFRGRKLEISNFNSAQISELALLIGNKEAENFRLEISKIELI